MRAVFEERLTVGSSIEREEGRAVGEEEEVGKEEEEEEESQRGVATGAARAADEPLFLCWPGERDPSS